MKSILLAVILTVFACPLWADVFPQQPHVYVEGSADVEAEPDMMTFSLSLQKVDMDLAKAKADVDQRSRLLISICKKFGVNSKDIATTALNIRPEYQYQNQQRTFTGNNVSRQVDITLRDITKYPQMMKALVDAKVSETVDTQLTLSNKKALEDKAQDKAMADARARAERLAKTQGRELAGVWSISEFNTRGDERWSLLPSRQLSGNASGSLKRLEVRMSNASEPFEPGVMKLTAQVYVVFLLK